MKFLRKIAPFLLIPLMLFSSIGFSLDVHFCGNKVKSIGFFNATPCNMESEMNLKLGVDISNLPPCHQKKIKKNQNSEKKNGLNQGNCCHNESFFFDANSELEPLSKESAVLMPVTAVLVYAVIRFHLLKPKVPLEFYENYKPPLMDEDISILHQVFRI